MSNEMWIAFGFAGQALSRDGQLSVMGRARGRAVRCRECVLSQAEARAA